jgi:hypothetical protein
MVMDMTRSTALKTMTTLMPIGSPNIQIAPTTSEGINSVRDPQQSRMAPLPQRDLEDPNTPKSPDAFNVAFNVSLEFIC